MAVTVYTIGHSTRAIGEFIELLRGQGVTMLADIRTIPASRHNPQYQQESLSESLRDAGIEYVYLAKLGGLRSTAKAQRDERNAAWRNASFRSYADYMQTGEFAQGIEDLLTLTRGQTVAVMCAEAVPWRCHRSLVGDALLVRGVQVRDIIGGKNIRDHTLTPFAVVTGKQITYPAPGGESQDA